MMQERKSVISSFKSNRFNNMFEAGAALHYHREEIIDFLQSHVEKPNWKQQGVLEDMKCDQIDNILVALGLLYFRLTGPYWRLLQKPDLQVVTFYTYTVMMVNFIER